MKLIFFFLVIISLIGCGVTINPKPQPSSVPDPKPIVLEEFIKKHFVSYIRSKFNEQMSSQIFSKAKDWTNLVQAELTMRDYEEDVNNTLKDEYFDNHLFRDVNWTSEWKHKFEVKYATGYTAQDVEYYDRLVLIISKEL